MKIIKKIVKFIYKVLNLLRGKEKEDDGEETAISVEAAYGGVNFNKAKEDPNAVIGNLTVTNDAMRYSWVKGDLRGWGLDDGNAGALAIFAVKGSDGKWRGGKFEWISKSRTTRSFGNIKGGYGGWPKDAIETAKGYAFCICSKDASKRTNWIVASGRNAEVIEDVEQTPIEQMG